MARNFAGSNDYLSVLGTTVTAAPLSVAGWVKSTSDAVAQAVFNIGVDGSFDNYWLLTLGGNVGGDPVIWRTVTTTQQTTSTSSGYSVNTWHHVCGVELASNSRAVYIDGGSKGINTVLRIPAGVDSMWAGRIIGGSFQHFNGLIAELGVWNIALTDDDVGTLADGCSPLCVRPENLVSYMPFVRDEDNDIIGGLNFSVTGTVTVGDHPRIVYPTRKHISFPTVAVGATDQDMVWPSGELYLPQEEQIKVVSY